MTPFLSKITALTSFRDNLNGVIADCFKENEEYLIDLNRHEQLVKRGIDGEGLTIVPPYEDSTKELKQIKGQITSHVTLRDTGSFQDSFELEVGPSQAEITSPHYLLKTLQKKYGTNILGITPEFLQDFTESVIFEKLIHKLNELLDGK